MNKAQKITVVVMTILTVALIINQLVNNFNFSL